MFKIEKSIKEKIKKTNKINSIARNLYTDKRYSEALNKFQKYHTELQKLDPKVIPGLNEELKNCKLQINDCYDELGKINFENKNLNEAKINFTNSSNDLFLAKIAFLEKEYEKALSFAQKALKKISTDTRDVNEGINVVDARYCWAMSQFNLNAEKFLLFNIGILESAVKLIDKFKITNDIAALVLFNLAIFYETCDPPKSDDAIILYEKAAALNLAEAYQNLGIIYQNKKISK